jgi:hypothetical protein
MPILIETKAVESYSFYWLLFHMSRSHHKSGHLSMGSFRSILFLIVGISEDVIFG